MPANKPLKLIFWNAHSITSLAKKLQLQHIAQTEQIDIIMLVETFLKPHHNFELNDYNVYRQDRVHQAHGGVAIAIKKQIKHKLCESIKTNFIENIAIEIQINGIQTCIAVAYSPRSSNHFSADIQLLTSFNSQYMIFGDFNAKHTSWNCHSNNSSGNSLFSLQQTHDFLVYHTDTHTHFPDSGRKPSTIDLLLSNIGTVFDISTHQNHMQSDHAPIITTKQIGNFTNGLLTVK